MLENMDPPFFNFLTISAGGTLTIIRKKKKKKKKDG